MKMTKTLEALGSHGFTHDVSAPIKEVEQAQEVAAMLRKLVETHWSEGDMRAAVREAEALLAKVGG